MPCRCDDYPDPPVPAGAKPRLNAEHEHTRACKAQSLVHKLALIIEAKCPESLSKSLGDRVEATRKELLAHKRQELDDDIKKYEQEIKLAMSNIGTIRKLGGSPNHDLVEKIDKLRRAKVSALNITDDELLGKE